MTTHNIIQEEEYHLIQPYDGSAEPTHDDDEAIIIEDEDEEIEEEEAYL